jgi:hypothetical protein
MKTDRRSIISIVLTAIAGIIAMQTFASESGAVSALANASATVVVAETVTEQLFTNISQVASGGSITMSLDGSSSVSSKSSVLLQDLKSNAVTFIIIGSGNNTYAVTLPPNASLNSASSNDIAANTLNSGTEGTGIVAGGNKSQQVIVKLNSEDKKALTGNVGSSSIIIDYN